jgi:hypothetical protein
VNDTTGVDRACPFATRNETPKRTAEVASVAADRRFKLTGRSSVTLGNFVHHSSGVDLST